MKYRSTLWLTLGYLLLSIPAVAYTTTEEEDEVIAILHKVLHATEKSSSMRAPRPGGELIASQGVVGPCVICPSIDPELIFALQNQPPGGTGNVIGPVSSTINAVARYANTVGTELKNSAVLVDDAGNVELQGITKNGTTVSWPSGSGALGTFLGSDGAGNLIYATPAGAGNVSTAVPFTTDNRIVTVDLPNGSDNVKESAGVTLDGSNNISGVNTLDATTVNAPTLNGNATSATTATNAVNFTGPLVGDVTGTQGATVVSFVGGESAADVAAATVLANDATSANTANTIVRRDASGDFAAGVITADLNGNATSATTATSATNFTGPLVGDVTGTQGATVVSFVGGESAADVAAATVLANDATSANTANAIVRRDASGDFAAGVITASLAGAASLNVLKAGDTMTGILTMPAGSTAAPSIQFTGSTNTGMTAAAADILSLVTAGLERLKIDASGNTTYKSNYKALAYSTNTQSFGVLVTTLIFNNTLYDPNNNYNTATGVYTVPFTGTYLVSYTLNVRNSSSTNQCTFILKVNGVPSITGTQVLATLSGTNVNFNIANTVLANMNAGDQLWLDAQSSPSNVFMESGSHIVIHFMSF